MLSKVSVEIIPNAKNPAKIKAVWTPIVADATTNNVIAEICVAVSNPRPNTNPVTSAEPTGPKTPVLLRILLASIAEPLLPHFFME